MKEFLHKHRATLRIVGIYALVGLVWIYASDSVLSWLVQDRRILTELAIFKGCVYVALTSLLLFFLVGRHSRDLTDSQRALKASERYLRTILETEPECVKLLDADGNLLMMNRAGLEMIDAESFDQVAGKPVTALVTEPFRGDFTALTGQVFRGTHGTLEFEIVGLKGRHLRLETHAVPFCDENGKIVALLGVTRDVTLKKQASFIVGAQTRLNDILNTGTLQDVLHAVLEDASAMTGSTLSYLHFLEEDQRTLRRQTWSVDAREQIHLAAGERAPEAAGDSAAWSDCIAFGKPASYLGNGPLARLAARGGTATPVPRELVSPIVRDHRVVALIGVANKPGDYTTEDLDTLSRYASIACDIVLRKESETARQQSEERYRSLVENIPLGIAMMDTDCRIVMVNSTQARWFGHPPAWFVGRFCYQAFEKLDQVCSHCPGMVSLASGETCFKDTEGVKDDGSRISARLRSVPLYGPDGQATGFIEVIEDITEQKRIEEEHRRIEKQMLHAQKLESLGVLAGGIAHDFNNILMSIMGNADLALMRINQESPAVENLQQIEKASARAADLAKQMLAYSGKGKFVVESIDLNRLLEEMLHMLEISISKRAALRLDLARPLPAVEADATQIRQIVMNLVINASEALGDQNGVIAISTGCLACDRDYLQDVWLTDTIGEGLYVYLEIADTGCGMDKETLAKIFDPFFTTKFSGRGLGMAAVLGIVKGHNGAIKVYSEPGRGSSFKILLPAGDRPADPVKVHGHDTDWQGSGTVLLVDDEETVRDIGSAMLKELGFTPITADDGLSALAVYRERPDIVCVILDLTMPHMDGEQCFRELRRIHPGLPVIMSSGYNEQEVTERFAGCGLSGFIQKPYKLSELEKAIMALRLT